jgi:penicillin-binding protein 1C
MGCLLRSLLAGLFLVAVVGLCGVSMLLFQYYSIARTLPDIRDLRQRASQFETTRIMDRNGNMLYEILDPTAGRRTYVPLGKISPYLVAATIATEDKEFYNHPGVDIFAILRAVWQNYQSGETVSGASTITQQLARALLLSPEERTDISYQRKVREAILATEITRRYSKDEILELYLNEIYYGNLAYGIEAAAETYFGLTADKLTLGQAAFLAGLPQSPSVYDVYTNPEITFNRQETVLVLMFEASQEQGCIYVSNYPQRICIDPVAVTIAAQEVKDFQFRPPGVQMRYPHWVNYIRSILESQFDAQTIYRSGFSVYTTLDPGLQDTAQQLVREHVDSLADKNVQDGALIALRPSTGEILAMVGSADFYNEAISGQINMGLVPRQPGSAMKPLTYAAAFEKGWTPSTLIWDVYSEFPPSGRPDDNRPPYKPVNYDGRFHGPVSVRSALANSFNIPAVKTLDFVGIYDDPGITGDDGLIAFARRLGITSLTRDDYGLSLTLGGGEVSLMEMTNAYAVFANNGRRVPPVAITRILDHQGNLVYEYQQPPGEQVMRSEHAFLISSILSDNEARTPMFGAESPLRLPFAAAAKTGTTNDFRDNLTIGYTPDVVAGVWMGNADYTPMQNTSGLTGAAPVWNAFMQAAVQQLTGGSPTPFARPGGIADYVVCEVSGTLPSEWCPSQRSEIFAADQPPLPKTEDLWQRVTVDTWTELKASSECSDFTDEIFALNVTDPWARRWIRDDDEGQAWAEENGFPERVTFAPTRECKADDPRPRLAFVSPRDGESIREEVLEIEAVAGATQWFDYFQLEWGIGEDPVEWHLLDDREDPVNDPAEIYEWDLEELVNEEDLRGPVTLRLYMHSTEDTEAETLLHLSIMVATQTPTPTETSTPTPTPTDTPTATPTWTPTNTPSPTATNPPTSTPSHTPEPTSTPEPTTLPEPTKFLKATEAPTPGEGTPGP